MPIIVNNKYELYIIRMSTRLFIIHINSSIENKEYQMKSEKKCL